MQLARRRYHPPSSQVPEALPQRKGLQDDSFLTETSRGGTSSSAQGPWRSLGGSGREPGWQQIPKLCEVSWQKPTSYQVVKWDLEMKTLKVT